MFQFILFVDIVHLCLLYSGYSSSHSPSIPPMLLLLPSLLLPSLGTGLWVLFVVTLGLKLCIVCSGSQLKTGLPSPQLQQFSFILLTPVPWSTSPHSSFVQRILPALGMGEMGQGSSFAVPVLSRHTQANSGIQLVSHLPRTSDYLMISLVAVEDVFQI